MATTLQVHACTHRAPPQALSILLLASILLASSAEPPPPSYRLDLVHVDANGNFPREELIQRAANRTFLREATLSATDSTASSTKDSVAVFTEYSHHEYLINLAIGTPPKPFLAVADTGSDLTWMRQCDKSFAKTCSRGDPGCCDCNSDNPCKFEKKYGSKKETVEGLMGSEILTLSPEKKGRTVPIGCACKCGARDDNCNNLLPINADGLVGLSRSPNSLLAKLEITKFSYCLNNPHHPELRSQFWFGNDLRLDAGVGSGATVNTTPLVEFSTIKPLIDPKSVLAAKYYVELIGISIGEKHKKLVSETKKMKEHKESGVEGIKLRSNTDNPIMFVDSGCSFSLLENDVFQVLIELLHENELKTKTDPRNGKGSTCFVGVTANNMPEIVLHFTGANMFLPWTSYSHKSEHDSLLCLAIKRTDKGFSVLGNFQQQNIRMLYDLDGDKLSFVRVDDCGKL